MRHSRIIFVISLLVSLIIFFTRCVQDHSPEGKDPRGNQYAGSKTCVTCHQNIFNSYTHSNHYRTSSEVDSGDLKKLIGASRDYFYFTDSSHIRIEEEGGSFLQSNFMGDNKMAFAKFDIAFGSAEKAQTYGYWKEGKLFQLPLTYFTHMSTWANSPGFPSGHARFDRVIESRCFECHASFVDKEFVQSGTVAVSEKLDRNSIIYGIDCERCHGPAAEHVQFHQENPTVKKSMYITAIKTLSRQQQLDVCGTCHSGNDKDRQKSLFAFVPGDTLSHFYYPDFGSGKAEPDVHGKQLQMLQSSMCFQRSGMTCTTCHDSHQPDGDQLAGFVSKCMNCHQDSDHALGIIKSNEEANGKKNLVNMNCIDCHMPLQASKAIYFNNGREMKNIPYLLRTHKIAIYNE